MTSDNNGVCATSWLGVTLSDHILLSHITLKYITWCQRIPHWGSRLQIITGLPVLPVTVHLNHLSITLHARVEYGAANSHPKYTNTVTYPLETILPSLCPYRTFLGSVTPEACMTTVTSESQPNPMAFIFSQHSTKLGCLGRIWQALSFSAQCDWL